MPELTSAMLRSHPVASILDAAATGQVPSEPELDALRLPPTQRRRVVDAAGDIVATKRHGENAAARQRARESAERIVSGLPSELQSPDYLRPPDLDDNNPEQLAARVPRW